MECFATDAKQSFLLSLCGLLCVRADQVEGGPGFQGDRKGHFPTTWNLRSYSIMNLAHFMSSQLNCCVLMLGSTNLAYNREQDGDKYYSVPEYSFRKLNETKGHVV